MAEENAIKNREGVMTWVTVQKSNWGAQKPGYQRQL